MDPLLDVGGVLWARHWSVAVGRRWSAADDRRWSAADDRRWSVMDVLVIVSSRIPCLSCVC